MCALIAELYTPVSLTTRYATSPRVWQRLSGWQVLWNQGAFYQCAPWVGGNIMLPKPLGGTTCRTLFVKELAGHYFFQLMVPIIL